MAKAGTITEIISKEAFNQVDLIEKRLNALVNQIEKVNQAAAATKSAGGATGTSTAQKAQNAEMQKAIDLTAKLTEEELKQARAKVEKQMRAKQAADAVREELNANEQIVGAYKKMSTELDKLRKQYKDMAAAGQGNTEEGKKLLGNIQELDKKIKSLDATVGQHQRNVGNYRSALSGLGDSFASMPGPIGAVGSAIQNVGRVMLANPIILVITAITAAIAALVKAFKDTDDGGTLIEARFQQISSIVSVVTDRIGRFATGLVDIFSGRFQDGWDKMTGAFDGMSVAILNAADAAYEYVYAMDEINDRITAFISQEAQLKNEIAKLMFASKDQTKSEKERAAALEQAMAKEKQLSEFKVTSAEDTYNANVKRIAAEKSLSADLVKQIISMDYKELESAKSKNKQIADAYNRLGEDNIKELENMYAAFINADTEYFNTTRRAISQLSGFKKQAINQEKADVAELNEEYQRQMWLVDEFLARFEGMAGMKSKSARTFSGAAAPKISQTPNKLDPNAGAYPSEITGESYEDLQAAELASDAAKWEAKIKMVQDAYNQINAIVEQAYALRLSKIDEEARRDEAAKEREIQLAGGNKAKIEEINKKYELKEKEREKEKRRLQQEQARYQKASAIIGAIINTALGISAGLQATPPPLGIVMAALAGVLGAAQVALIASQPLPSYAKGRQGGKAELANINERGQELVVTRTGEMYLPSGNIAYLPEGASVIPHHDLVDMAGRASTYGLPSYVSDSTSALREEINGLHAGFAMLAGVVRNKREAHISIDKHGIRTAFQDGVTYYEYLNNNVRL